DYLDTVASALRPLLERRGLSLFGAYTAPMRSDESILIWAAPDFRCLCELYASWETDAELQAYSKRVAAMEQESETMWLVPSIESFFHPLHGLRSNPLMSPSPA